MTDGRVELAVVLLESALKPRTVLSPPVVLLKVRRPLAKCRVESKEAQSTARGVVGDNRRQPQQSRFQLGLCLNRCFSGTISRVSGRVLHET